MHIHTDCISQIIYLHLQINFGLFPKDSIPDGLNVPKNLIVGPDCTQQCPPLIGTQGDDTIIATSTSDASIYGLGGNDFIQCGQGTCKAFAGPGDNVLVAGLLDTDNSRALWRLGK